MREPSLRTRKEREGNKWKRGKDTRVAVKPQANPIHCKANANEKILRGAKKPDKKSQRTQVHKDEVREKLGRWQKKKVLLVGFKEEQIRKEKELAKHSTGKASTGHIRGTGTQLSPSLR